MSRIESEQSLVEVRRVPQIHYRPFRNTDPPHLAEIWRARARERGIVHPMSAMLFEQLVLAKPYFDNEGLILAFDGKTAVGFVHAAFGPSEDQGSLSRQFGVTSMLMVRPDYRRLGIGHALLERSESYLYRRGAKVLYGGGIYPLNPFYLGLYGGSELPGVLASDTEAQRLYRSAGYQEVDQCVVLHRELADFRPPINRQQMQIRRNFSIREVVDPPALNWWDACTFGGFDRVRYDLVANDGARVAHATVWSMELLGATWGVRAVGLVDVNVVEAHRHQGLGTFLVSEIVRRLQHEGVGVVEAQAMLREHSAARALYQRLGFREIDRGTVFRKDEPGPSAAASPPAADPARNGS
jgi:GNAT superfamily N-acetyltransferase